MVEVEFKIQTESHYGVDESKELTEYQKMKMLIFPETSDGKEMTCLQKAIACVFPDFTWKSFTFWYGLLFLLGNVTIFIFLAAKNFVQSDKEHGFACLMVNMHLGTILPYYKFKHQYYRTFTSMVACDNSASAVIGWLCIWHYGFALEKRFPLSKMLLILLVGTTCSVYCGDYAQFKDIRTEGSTAVIVFMSMHPGVIYKDYRNNKCIIIVLSIILGCLWTGLVVSTYFTQTGDMVAAITAIVFGTALSFAVLLSPDRSFKAGSKFIINRLRIYITVMMIMFTLVMMAYCYFLYNNEAQFNEIEKEYLCSNAY